MGRDVHNNQHRRGQRQRKPTNELLQGLRTAGT
jgi:hypothetical protein